MDWPIIVNLRLDPFERMGLPTASGGSPSYGMDFFGHEFWCFVYIQKIIGEHAETFIEFAPMQKGASFNIESPSECWRATDFEVRFPRACDRSSGGRRHVVMLAVR